MKAKKFFLNTYFKGSLFVIAGLLIGWLLFYHSTPEGSTVTTEVHEHSETEKTIWTCSMHPQFRMDNPGDCPICGMDLIPLKNADAEIDDQAIEMSESAMKLAQIQTSFVSKGSASKDLRLYGKIQMDERLQQSQTAHVPGRIEELMINVTGEKVKKGQLIARIYSPELVTSQKELVEAISLKDKYPELIKAAREKLHNWKLSDSQITEIERSGKVRSVFDIYANTSGIVNEIKVNEGDYIAKGTVIFDVVDLSKVWGVFDAYESDLAWISMNQSVEFTAQAIPGKTFTGKISFIDPVIDARTRIARVRIELNNSDQELKPEMFINGIIHSSLKGMENQLAIPQSAVLWTGKRSVVYVKIGDAEHPAFKLREITLGSAMKDTYIVVDGLTEGEEIVTNGTFSVDAAAQLAGKTSMMNPVEKSESGDGMSGMKMDGKTENMNQFNFKVAGNCSMCKDRIEAAAKSVNGVSDAEWSSENQMLKIKYDDKLSSTDIVQEAIAKVGHDTEKFKADDSVYKDLHECCLYERLSYPEKQDTSIEDKMFKVAGNCGMCKDRIEKAAKSVKGVMSANWSSENQMLSLKYNNKQTTLDIVQKAIAKVGHDTENYKADDSVYSALPECCLYDRTK